MKNPSQIAQFGMRLKKLRKEAGYTQDALAYEAGIATRSIYVIEHGEQAVSLDILISLARALGKKPSEMLDGIDVEFE